MSLFTGLYEFNHGVDIARSLDPKIPTLTEKASEKFITFGFHSGMGMRKRWGYSRGFDYYKRVPHTGPLYPKAGQNLFKQAVALLEKANFPDFFFFLHTYQVHDPYTPPLDFLLKLEKNPAYKKLDVVNQNAPWKTFHPESDDLRKSLKKLYQAEIHAFDSYFGEFIEKLKSLGIYDNAMIVFMSDHGEEFYEHKGWAHSHSLYNELIKVPVMIKFPGNNYKNTPVNDNIGVIDLIPTILSFYEVGTIESKIDGVDLMPLIRGEKEARRREYLISSVSESRYIREIPPKLAIIYGDYKIIYNESFSSKDLDYFKPYGLPPDTPQIEVYDLKKDSRESHNIALQKTELVKKIMPLIIKIRKIIKDNMIEKKKNEVHLDEEAKKQLKSLGYINP
jgi:arylsulfatase A-like enzyme